MSIVRSRKLWSCLLSGHGLHSPPVCSAPMPAVGADLSHLPRLQSAGAEYRAGGAVVEPLGLFHDAGFGVVRLRLWHSPAESWNGLDSTIAFGRRVRAAGLRWMLDLHYSDTWADPGQQLKPRAWAALPHAALVDSVRACTRDVLLRCRAAGVLPEYVQLGNEIDSGFLWDDGRVGRPGSRWDTTENGARTTELLAAAASVVRDSFPSASRPSVLLHLAQGGDDKRTRWFLDHLEAAGIEYEAVGVSYYPWWHGPLDQLARNLRTITTSYGNPVRIVETAYLWTLGWADSSHNFVGTPDQLLPGSPATPRGRLAFLRE